MQGERRKFVQTFIDPIISNHFEGGADYSTSKEFEQKLNKLVDQYYQPPNKVVEDGQATVKKCKTCGRFYPVDHDSCYSCN